jgi:hypothetical protein
MTDVVKRPRAHLIAMIVATVLYGASFPFVLSLAMFSPMASDSGVTTKIWIFIVSLMTLPIGIAVAVILGWIFYATRLPKLMWAAILFPLLWIFPIGFSAL